MASSGGRRLRALIITVIVLVVLLVAADRITLVVAENTAADNIQSSQDLPNKPDVSVAGFPFLTQLASGSYGKITITDKDIPVAKSVRELDISKVTVVLHSVHASNNFSTVHADRATATASVGYAELSKTLGVTVSYADNHTIRTSKTISIAGQSATATISTKPKVVNGRLTFTSSTVNGISSVAQSVTDELTKAFDLKLPLDGIPFKLRVTDLSVGKSGLSLTLAGTDLTFTKS